MTDIAKAIAFARECLKWTEPYSFAAGETVIDHAVPGRVLSVDSLAAIQSTLESFLGQRFSIQINRGTSSLFKWSVIVGLQGTASVGRPSCSTMDAETAMTCSTRYLTPAPPQLGSIPTPSGTPSHKAAAETAAT